MEFFRKSEEISPCMDLELNEPENQRIQHLESRVNKDDDVAMASSSRGQSALSQRKKSYFLELRSNSLLLDPLTPNSGKDVHEDEDPIIEHDFPEYLNEEKMISVVESIGLIIVCAALIFSLRIEMKIWILMLYEWETVILIIILGKLVSKWLFKIIVFFIQKSFSWRKRILYFLFVLRKCIQNCVWLALIVIAWFNLVDKKVYRATHIKAFKIVAKILVCVVMGVTCWIVKTLLIKMFAFSFHSSAHFDRIMDSLLKQYIIKALSSPIVNEVNRDSRVLRSTTRSHSRSKKEYEEADSVSMDLLHKLTPHNVSAWMMKRLMNLIRNSALSVFDEQIQTEINNENEAKIAVKKIYQNVSVLGSRYIYLDNIKKFMREDEAERAMSLFNGASENKQISKSTLKRWMVNALRERQALVLTLNNSKTAINRLHQVVNVLVSIFILVMCILILGVATSEFVKYLLIASAEFLVLAFIFGNSLRTIFEAMIFFFVAHPFEVGDRCEIDDLQVVVEEKKIWNTIFLRNNNQKIIIPNSTLATKIIHNNFCSPHMEDAIEFSVHLFTSAWRIDAMKQRILSYIKNKKEHWYPKPKLRCKDLEELNRLKYNLSLKHRMNHQDMEERWERRGVVVEEIANILRDLEINKST